MISDTTASIRHAELTEAINSMFRWYKRATKCYVYLEDLPPQAPWSDLRHCRWFTRSWTLQELIAPGKIDFYDQEWNFQSTKTTAINVLSGITDIIPLILQHKRPLSTISVVQRMSWAARRQTTRVEDMAYSLLGIFTLTCPFFTEKKKEPLQGSRKRLSRRAWT
jgi:hypothetical protein